MDVEFRPDLAAAVERAWLQLGAPGTWWPGEERVAISVETRKAAHCGLCSARKAALSPMAVDGRHVAVPGLGDAAVDAIHRIATDSGRLGEGWFATLLQNGLSDGQYVEIVSIVAVVAAVDTFRRGRGLDELPFPAPWPGHPDRQRPRGAKRANAWVDVLLPADRTDADPNLYGDGPDGRQRIGANIHLALSLVPRSMMHWWDMFEAMYLTGPMMRDFAHEYRAITHAQIELLAARTAALHRCIY